mmetsp:Transcript_11614/g.22104  ORF Transcript_11614/g.22104 Transcript_11614/m.22104 type:complete len:91 (+) Transcript_11614:1-273(+)
MLYSEEGSNVHDMAEEMKAVFLSEKTKYETVRKRFFGAVWLILLFRRARIRANHRLYSPGGRGYLKCKDRFETGMAGAILKGFSVRSRSR